MRKFTTMVLSFLLAMLMAVMTPLTVFAKASEDKYVKEIIIITADQINDAKNDGWIVVETPLYTNPLDEKNGATSTYLAYKTTNTANEAITDIRAMNMNGGWSFAEYEDLLDSLKESAKKQAATLWNAVVEFRRYYKTNGDRENVRYAYDLLNVLVDDDVKDANGNPMKLGDLLLNEELIPSAECETFTTLFLESNVKVLQVIYSALATACSKNSAGKTFLDVLNENQNDLTWNYADDDSLDTDVNALLSSWYDARDSVLYYESCVESYESLLEADEVNKTDNSVRYIEGKTLTEALSGVEYWGPEYEYDSLLDCLMSNFDELTSDMSDEEKEHYILVRLRPVVAAMTPGLRCAMALGFARIVCISVTEDGNYYTVLDELTKDEEKKAVMDEGISVFYGVDREIYEDHYTALTSAALRANAEGDTSWQKAQSKEDQRQLFDDIAKWMAVGSGVLFGVSAGYISMAAGLFAQNFGLSFGKSLGNILTATSEIRYVGEGANAFIRAAGEMLMAAFMIAGAVIAIAGFIVALVLYLIPGGEDLVYTDYKEIPAKLCDYRVTFDEETKEEIEDSKQYIYYDCALNPYGVRTVSLFAQDDKEAQQLPENKKPSMDIFNWELRGNRQWLCLYATKDRRAGFPIKNGSLQIQNEMKTAGLKVPTFSGSNKTGFDLASLYNKSVKDNPAASGNDNNYTSSVYLYYAMDPDAVYEKTTTDSVLDILSSRVGSAVSNGATWAIGAIGLLLGGFGGIMIKSNAKNTKKKDDTAQ